MAETTVEPATGVALLAAYYVRGDDLLAVMRPATAAGWTTRHYHADGLGSIRALTDEAGTVTDRYTFTAFGELLDHTGDDPNAYLFAGEMLDPNAGFYYNRARWMDPGVGRFASVDSFGGLTADPISLHRYVYSNLDPTNRTDPSGLYSVVNVSIGFAISAMVSSIALGAVLHYLAVTNFPSDALSSLPDAWIVGFQWSVALGRLVRWIRHPVAVGLSLGLILTSGAAALEILIPRQAPNRAWLYLALGVSVGLPTTDTGPASAVPSIYVGAAWNASTGRPDDTGGDGSTCQSYYGLAPLSIQRIEIEEEWTSDLDNR